MPEALSAPPPGGVMGIIKSQPPNIDAIRKAFPAMAGHRGLLFAFLPNIYNPDGVQIPPHLVRHEIAHMRQQAAVGGPEKWWELYLADRDFRLKQEIEACVAERLTFCFGQIRHNRRERFAHLETIVERLSSGVYGYMIRRQKAKATIQRAVAERQKENETESSAPI